MGAMDTQAEPILCGLLGLAPIYLAQEMPKRRNNVTASGEHLP